MSAETSAATTVPVGLDDDYLGEQSRLEQMLGPEWYRLLKGVVTNPLSVAGILIIFGFMLMAAFAPLLAPPINENWDTTLIPRDGFSSEPKPPGSEWTRNTPETVPTWYKLLTGNDQWVHLMGTTSGQYDIWYGIVWGSRTALVIGSLVVAASAAIGIAIGAFAGFYGGWIDEALMRVVEIF
ncbi:MAG: hypothetical protein R6X34_14380, partial [Chloroflexota bacterium]